jgi:hypothetical protein
MSATHSPTNGGRILTADQLAHYNREGYLILRNVVPLNELDKYRYVL